MAGKEAGDFLKKNAKKVSAAATSPEAKRAHRQAADVIKKVRKK